MGLSNRPIVRSGGCGISQSFVRVTDHTFVVFWVKVRASNRTRCCDLRDRQDREPGSDARSRERDIGKILERQATRERRKTRQNVDWDCELASIGGSDARPRAIRN